MNSFNNLVRGIVDHHINASKGIILAGQIFHVANLNKSNKTL